MPLITQHPKLGHTWGEVSEGGEGDPGVSTEDPGALGRASWSDMEAPRGACRGSQGPAMSRGMG